MSDKVILETDNFKLWIDYAHGLGWSGEISEAMYELHILINQKQNLIDELSKAKEEIEQIKAVIKQLKGDHFINNVFMGSDRKLIDRLLAENDELSKSVEKFQADAVREAAQQMLNKSVIPKALKIRQEYYKAAVVHCGQFLNSYANELEQEESENKRK